MGHMNWQYRPIKRWEHQIELCSLRHNQLDTWASHMLYQFFAHSVPYLFYQECPMVLVCHSRSSVTYSHGPCVSSQVLSHIFTWSLCVLPGPLSHIHVVLVCHSRSSVTYSHGPCVSFQVLSHIFTWSLCVLPGPLSHIHMVLVCPSRSSVTYPHGLCVSFQVLCHIFTWSLYVLPGPLSHIHMVLVCPFRSSTQGDDTQHE